MSDDSVPVRQFSVERLPVAIYSNSSALGQAAADSARIIINESIQQRGACNVILATGNSQLEFLHALRKFDDIDWSKVLIFHMDEYLGIDSSHPASFPLFLHRHFLDFVSVGKFYPVPNKPEDIRQACRNYEQLLRDNPVDLVAMGFGENGHLAFNDPPYADFNDPTWVKVVKLDDISRQQQVGEGHFGSVDEVPAEAITLTIPALLAPRHILCIVPEARKAQAVHDCLYQPVSDQRPGSILRTVENAQLYLDLDSSSKINIP